MISVIICSRQHDITEEQRQSIETSIGLPHEIVVIDNNDNHHTIFSAYNEGVERSKYEILCFMHDDVLCHQLNWGQILCHYFEDPHIGLVGISGPLYLSSLPAPWWSVSNSCFNFQSIAQCVLDTNRKDRSISRHATIPEQVPALGYTDVVVCDGILLAIPKHLFRKIRFDEDTYSGFHFYDLDISLQVKTQGYRCIASYQLGIEHISSPDSLNASWINESKKFYRKWNYILPQSVTYFNIKQKINMQINSLRVMNGLLGFHGMTSMQYYNKYQLLLATYIRVIEKMEII